MSDVSSTEQPLVILSENPIEQIWTQLSAWESRNLARKLIAERAQKAGAELAANVLEGNQLDLSSAGARWGRVRNSPDAALCVEHSGAISPCGLAGGDRRDA